MQNAADINKSMALFMTAMVFRYMNSRGFDVNGHGWIKRLFIISMEA